MSIARGDVILAQVAFVGTSGAKVRPGLVVQADYLNATLNETVIATITSNTANSHQPHQLFIDVATPDGASTGLLHNSAIRWERLHAIPQSDVRRSIGKLSSALMNEIDECLKAALGIS